MASDIAFLRKMTWSQYKKKMKKEGFEIVETPRGYGYVAEFARAHFYMRCPFCTTELKIYIWSFHGGGKKCYCGAKLGVMFCTREIKKNGRK